MSQNEPSATDYDEINCVPDNRLLSTDEPNVEYAVSEINQALGQIKLAFKTGLTNEQISNQLRRNLKQLSETMTSFLSFVKYDFLEDLGTFSGENECICWFQQYRLYHSYSFDYEQTRLEYARCFMRGRALEEYDRLTKNHEVVSVDGLENAFQHIFGLSNQHTMFCHRQKNYRLGRVANCKKHLDEYLKNMEESVQSYEKVVYGSLTM